MADFEVRNIMSLQSEGSAGSARINRRGELVTVPWHVQLALDGKVHAALAGTETAPITIANLVIDQDQPEFLLRVPSGVTVIPLTIIVGREATGAGITETEAWVSTGDPGNGTSSAIALGPINLGVNIGGTSACTARQLVTAEVTVSSLMEFWRHTEPVDADSVGGACQYVWSHLTHATPVIKGPGGLGVCTTTGTSSTGFITVVYAEFSSGEILS